MAIRSLGQITCSLNLGLIYSLDYQYSPEKGIGMKLFFVNQQGIYNRPTLFQKAFIQVGNSSFSMYAVAYEIQYSQGRRVISVDFEDDTFMLKKYYIALPGRGCGTNVFILGVPVDNRTPEQKVSTALDPVAQQIANLTQFSDYQYSFNDFLALLQTKIPVTVLSSFDGTLSRDFEGNFIEVLNNWCNYYNLSFFFENGVIKVFDPTRLTIILPTKPADAISYTEGEDFRDTYGKTVCNWFQQDGDQFPLSQTSSKSGPLYVRTNTLYPVGYEFGLAQTTMDLGQVAAAMYGQEFWFLYNYSKGSVAEQCGWTPAAVSPSLSISQSAAAVGSLIASVNQDIFEQRYAAYRQYGESVAGRWYLSNEESDLAVDQGFKWFDETNGQIFDFTNVEDKVMNLEFLTPTVPGINQIPDTVINSYYAGVNYVGNRIVYRYNSSGTVFTLGDLQGSVLQTFQTAYGVQGSESMDFSQLTSTSGTFLAYPINVTIPQPVQLLINNIQNQITGFQPKFTSVPIKGIFNSDYGTLKASQSEPSGINIVNGNNGPSVITNTSVIKTLQQGSYTIYYDKYSTCSSASTPDLYYGYQFDPRQISIDNQLTIIFSKNANNTYTLSRDYGIINGLVNNPLLSQLAQARVFNTKRVSFTVNYFRDVPVNFLSQGLVGLSVSIGDNGISATYEYSNEVLRVPDKSREYTALEQIIKNSYIRTYRPTQVIQ